ncbi:MAG: MotA/TolQ/ExbB proton channel family protein [Fibrobacteria bacterium]|nr:MotA/TolQ/ExbB proton channel family protein [Fibrobacteria bacterium]
MLFDYLYEILKSGGWVLLPILLVGALGFYLVGLVLVEMGRDFFRRDYSPFFDNLFLTLEQGKEKQALNMLKKKPGKISWCLQHAIENRHLNEDALIDHISEELNKGIYLLDRHLPMITVLAAVAPLLGLLGTVSGMVHTFQVITEYGNSNPVLMAGGISEALITTQSGLLIAFPLVIFKHQLEDRISWIKKQVDLGVTRLINIKFHANGGANHGNT